LNPAPLLQRARTWFPAAAFLGGFGWDAVTLGYSITSFDLALLAVYWVAAAVILVLIGRAVRFRYSEYLNYALQFFFGGIFSALTIFYFLSSSDIPGLLFVAAIVALLVANEFLESRYSRLTLSWTFLTVAGIMLLNFTLPHLFRSVSRFWFYLSTLLALLAVLALRRVSRQGYVNVVPALTVTAVLIALFAFNLIPPVPLVKKEMLIARDLVRRDGVYAMTIEKAPWWRFWNDFDPVVDRRPGERIYAFTSVFVPHGIETQLRHRWMRKNPATGAWETRSTISFAIRGGRQTGYRGYTYKDNLPPGEWKVIAESEYGAAVGVVRFTVREGSPARLTPVRL
jgi:hypothetical protein